jgi:hypothetical protein
MEMQTDMWTDADYVELTRASKEAKRQGEASEEPPASRKTCPDCKRPVAVLFDEVVHNTGACCCEKSKALCWRGWNENVCCPDSPYAR